MKLNLETHPSKKSNKEDTLDIAIISTPMGCKGGWIQGARRVAKGGKNIQNILRNLISTSMGENYFQGFGSKIMGENIFSGILTQLFMSEKYFQEFGPIFSWVKHIFRNLVPKNMEKDARPLPIVYAIFLFAIE